MSRFDLYKISGGEGYLLDLQTDLLDLQTTRIVAPVMRTAASGGGVTSRVVISVGIFFGHAGKESKSPVGWSGSAPSRYKGIEETDKGMEGLTSLGKGATRRPTNT